WLASVAVKDAPPHWTKIDRCLLLPLGLCQQPVMISNLQSPQLPADRSNPKHKQDLNPPDPPVSRFARRHAHPASCVPFFCASLVFSFSCLLLLAPDLLAPVLSNFEES